MVNKRFNRKFRRALGAALGALAVSSISNIETIGVDFTETTLAGDPDIGWLFTLTRDQKKLIYEKIEAELIPQLRKHNIKSGRLEKINFAPAYLKNSSLSYPIFYRGFGNWEGAYTVTFSKPHRKSVRVTIMKTKDRLDSLHDKSDYLLAPAMSESEFRRYIVTHDVPWKGNWIKIGEKRPPVRAYLPRKILAGHGGLHFPVGLNQFNFANRDKWEKRYDPIVTPPTPLPPYAFVAPMGYNGDASYLTRWFDKGLMDVSIWNEILGDVANKNKMFYDIATCPPELRSFYYPPEEKKEDTTLYSTSSNTPNQPVNSNMTSMAPAMTAMLAAPAIAMATNQPAPTPANVVANNNVTQGSNNVGAAPAAQNGSVSSGSADVGPTSQTGSDGKLTNVQHDAKSKSDSNEPLKT